MSDTIFRTTGTVTTLLGIYNQFHTAVGLQYTLYPQTTLDAKYGLHENAINSPGSLPMLRYAGIGVRGYQNTDNQQGAQPYMPAATNMDLYTPIPFRVRPIDNDLTMTERVNYRFREVREIGGQEYALYWLKLIEFNPKTVNFIRKDAEDIESPFTLDPSYLSPEPPDMDVGGTAETNQNRVIVRATGHVIVTGAEIAEVSTYYRDKNGNSYGTRISEYGFYTGCEYWVDETGKLIGDCLTTDKPAIYEGREGVKESVYVQLAKHQCTLGDDLSEEHSSVNVEVNFEASNFLAI